jgi:hypothetical protein
MLICDWLLWALAEAPPQANVNSLAVRDASLPLDQRLSRITAPRLEGLKKGPSVPSSSDLSTAFYETTGRERLYADERRRLDSYGWIDRERGIVHIPIDRAIAIMAEKGMPYRKNGASGPQARAGEKKP